MNPEYDRRVRDANGGRDGFKWLDHTDKLKAMSAVHATYADEHKALNEEIAALERKVILAKARRNWLDALELVAAGFAEARFRPSGTRSIIGIYLRDPNSPTRVSLLTAMEDTPEHDREARAASPSHTVYASATL